MSFWARCLAGLACLPALAQPVRPMAEVPPHHSPWIEISKPDLETVLLWKFRSEQEQESLEADALEKDLLETDGSPEPEDAPTVTALPKADNFSTPRLQGGARPTPGLGRFGGGLKLDGKGFASADVPVTPLLTAQGGLTLDFWLKPARPSPDQTSTALAALADRRGKPLLMLQQTPDKRVVLKVDGHERLAAPLRDTADGWHHVALVINAPNGQPDHATLSLTLDGTTAYAERPDPFHPIPWFKGVPERLGERIYVGSAPGQWGLVGVIDEVRVSKGVRHLYPWNLGRQERPEDRQVADLRPPYFRTGETLTRFRFDGTVKPDVFAGRSWKGQADESHFRRGLKGQALDISRIDKTDFEMKGYYTLPEKDGTIEFWFRPLKWDNFFVGDYHGKGVQWYHLLRMTARGSRYGSPTKDIEVFRGRAQRDADIAWHRFHPGTWTHLLISLRGGPQTVYVNGRQQKIWQAGYVTQGHPYSQEPLKEWRKRTGGKDIDDTWTWRFVPSPTLIDELSIYSWGMNAEEAWNAYARWLPDADAQMKPLPVFRTDFDYFAHSWHLKEKLHIRLACLPVDQAKPASADCELRNADGEVLLSAEKQVLDDTGNTTFILDRPLPFGRYPVTVRSRDAAGAELKEEKLEYVRERPIWLGNSLGKERTVPKPWTPIEVEGAQVEVIGRKITLGKGGLPEQIETLGHGILAKPVAVRVAGPAGTGTLEGKGVRFTEKAEDRVAWKTALTGGGLSADLDAWMEFDGLIYCALALRPAAGAEAEIEELDVDFPLQPAAATQLLANGGGNNFRVSWIARYVPEGQGRVWNSLDKPYPAFTRAHGLTNYMPHIWLGSDEVGLSFGGENDQGWTVGGEKPAQEILRQDRAVVLRMNVIRAPTTITKDGHRFHFVIVPTPAKPEPPDWRKQMTSGGVSFGSCDTFGGFDMKTDPSDPQQGDSFRLEPRLWEHAEKMAPQCRDKWGRCILYSDASWPGFGLPFRDWNHDLHAGTGRLPYFPEQEDYMVWAVNEFLERGLIDGVYWDDVSVGYTYSLASTAYEYAGSENSRRVGFTALAQRRLNMRLWRLFAAAGKEPGIWAHMTVCYEVPLFSFCRYLSNCEFVTGVNYPGKRDAMDMWSPDTLRILGGSAKWGVGYHCLSTLPRTLPDTPGAKQWAYPQQRTETGLYLTSDIMQIPDGFGQVLVRERIFDGPVRAFPWWKADPVVSVVAPEGATVRAAVYALENRAVVIVANWDREPREVTIELKDGVLFPEGSVIAWRDLDPGLKPPEAAVASGEEIAKATKPVEGAATLDEEEEFDEEALLSDLEGTSKQDRDLVKLKLRAEEDRAKVIIRARDYRVLEARPIH